MAEMLPSRVAADKELERLLSQLGNQLNAELAADGIVWKFMACGKRE